MANNYTETKEYFDTFKDAPKLNGAENIELVLAYQNGDASALDTLVAGNIRLVAKIAKKYDGCGIPYTDLIQEGTMGLITAADKFDVEMGNQFSTVAVLWIRQAITRALANMGRMVRVPANVYESINKVRMVSRKLATELNHEPTTEEIAKAIGTTAKKVEKILDIAKEVSSLDAPVGDEEKNNVGDFVEDTIHETPEQGAEKADLVKNLNTVLSTLTEREKGIIIMRFGLDNGVAKTLEACAKVYGVSKERIRQIEAAAMKKLRNPIRANKLVDFLG